MIVHFQVLERDSVSVVEADFQNNMCLDLSHASFMFCPKCLDTIATFIVIGIP